MPSFTRHRAFRLTLIALYAIGAVLVAAALPVRTSFAVGNAATSLPGGLVAAFCHSDAEGGAGDGKAPDHTDHRSCCAACLVAGAPGLDAILVSTLCLPRVGSAVEAGFIVSERITIELPHPTSRGPPLA